MFRLFEKALDPTELPAQSQPPAGLIAFYWHFARQAKGLFAALFVAGFIVAVLDSSVPAFMGRIVTLVTSSRPETLWTENWRMLLGMADIKDRKQEARVVLADAVDVGDLLQRPDEGADARRAQAGIGGQGLGVVPGAERVGARDGPAAVQVGLAIGLGLALVLFSTTRSFPVALALLVVVGFLFSSFSALNNTLLMANCEPRLTGRVMSIYLLTWGATPVGSLPLAWVAETAGAPVALAIGGGLVSALVVGLAVAFPAGRRIGWSPAAVAAQPARR